MRNGKRQKKKKGLKLGFGEPNLADMLGMGDQSFVICLDFNWEINITFMTTLFQKFKLITFGTMILY